MSGELLAIQVKPRSSRAGVAIRKDGALVVRVHAPAAEGAANQECVRVLAEALDVPKSAVQIVRGEKSRSKQIAVAGITAAAARTRLERSAEREEAS